MEASRQDDRYRQRGVSAGKEEVHAAIARQDAGLFSGAFCKIIADELTGSFDHCLIVHADTAGTKASLGYLAWREGFPNVWRGIAQDALVMNLDDLGCVGALGPFLISNTIGRNAKLIPGAVLGEIIDGYQRLCDLLTRDGIPCLMTGGETADVGDLVRTLDVGCTITARLPRAEVIDAARITVGDVLVGFSSLGQAAWEDAPNSGIGSNGLTSARHELLGGYREKYPETYAPQIDPALVYCGKHRLEEPLPGDPAFTVGSALLSPTRTYLPLIKRLLQRIPRADVHGLIHCSGGGQTKILRFGAPGAARGLRFIKDALFPVPPLCAAIQASTGLKWSEMYSVYNMGHRLEAALPAAHAATAIAVARDLGLDAKIIGRVEANDGPGNVVEVRGGHGTFVYR